MSRPLGSSIIRYTKSGQKGKLTPDMWQKIQDAASNDFSVSEIINYIGVARETFYRWLRDNPEMQDRIEILRYGPRMTAKVSLAKGLKDNPELSLRYLEKRDPAEFGGGRSVVQINTQNNMHIENMNLGTEVKEAVVVFEEAMKKQLTAKPA